MHPTFAAIDAIGHSNDTNVTERMDRTIDVMEVAIHNVKALMTTGTTQDVFVNGNFIIYNSILN